MKKENEMDLHENQLGGTELSEDALAGAAGGDCTPPESAFGYICEGCRRKYYGTPVIGANGEKLCPVCRYKQHGVAIHL